MPRCDYDVIFYRVFCITLLGIAFTFTVILTNVFVDIDGLLYNEKVKSPKPVEQKTPSPKLVNLPPNDQVVQATFNQINADLSPFYHYDKQYDDESESNLDRSKRSLDTKSYRINVKNPKVKMLLTKQLSSLLEDLEEEESTTQYETTNVESSFLGNNLNQAEKLKEVDKIEKEGVLHLAMHNILLKGIINHMDLNDIYKTINGLSVHSETKTETRVTKKPNLGQQLADAEKIENKFLEELANCTRLRKEIVLARNKKNETKTHPKKKVTKIIINTVIDIKSVTDIPEQEKNKVNKENVMGVVKLLYNGQSVKFINAYDDFKNLTNDNMINTANIFNDRSTNPQENSDVFYKSSVDDYVNKFYKRESNIYPHLSELLEKRRSKRSAILKNLDHHKKGHKKPNEFYVEIETRFDKKDMDMTKKKQFVKELIKKIQKAIRTKDDPQKLPQKTAHPRSRHRIVQFKKRILSPFVEPLVKKLGIPADHVVHRQLDPISKIVPIREHFGPDRIASSSKDAWKDAHDFPSFLSRGKTINSAEIGEVNVEYDKVTDGVPQRLQLPLNSNNINDVLDGQPIDVGNIKLSIKDLDGTGLSIGFNQFLPESDKFVVYDGLENIFENFQENYEQGDKKEAGVSYDVNDEFAKTMVSFHDIIKRSATFDHQDSSQDKDVIMDTSHNKKHNLSITSLLGMGVMEKQKKPLTVQKFFNHRHNIKVKQYLNTNAISSKHKMYVLRKVASNKRRRRDLSNIRILTDILPGDVIANPDHSQENVFIVSDENIFDENPAEMRRPRIADKTATYDKIAIDQYDRLPSPEDFIYRDVKVNQHQEREDRESERLTEHERNHERDREQEQHERENLENPQVFVHEKIHDQTREQDHDSDLPYYHIQGDLSKNDPNLSNYPHIMTSKTDENSLHNIIFDAQEPLEPIEPKHNDLKPTNQREPDMIKPNIENMEHLPDLEELTNAIAPKTSYKVTVKLLPKNESNGDGTGVKEVFTTINKTFNKNGLLYSRLVNVSEIAKIESLNESMLNGYLTANEKEQDENHQNIILNNKLKKSEKDLKDLKQQRQILKDIINNNADSKTVRDKFPRRPKTFNNFKNPIHDFLSIPTRIRDTTKKGHTTKTTTNTKPFRIATPRVETPKLETKMTNAILAKIEENTNALKTFLQRLNKLEETPKRPAFPTSHSFMPMPSPHSLQPPFVMPTISNIDTHRNGSFIPFVYAFEHPYPSTNQTENNLSVVYHGHIHTKTGPKVKHFDINKLNSQKHSKRNVLRSRFFLDDVGTVIGTPMNVFKYKNYIKNPKIKINSTILI